MLLIFCCFVLKKMHSCIIDACSSVHTSNLISFKTCCLNLWLYATTLLLLEDVPKAKVVGNILLRVELYLMC